jgi:phenylalanyl-tRNA synthetase alpha subunit
LGTSRLAGQMYDIPKLKQLYDNDLRILRGVNR